MRTTLSRLKGAIRTGQHCQAGVRDGFRGESSHQFRKVVEMLYVMTNSWQPGLSREERDEALMRRAGWDYPGGVQVIGEWWPASNDVAVVAVFEADSFEPIMEIGFTWGDKFLIDVKPAVSAEEGLRIGPGVLERRG